MRLIKYSLLLIPLLFSNCATTFQPYQPPEIKFERTSKFEVGFQKIENESKKIGDINLVFVKVNETNNNLEIVENEEEATHILLIPEDLNKITAKLELGSQYKEIAISEEALINTYINQINALKEFIEIERTKSLVYRELWVNSENAYRQEQKERRHDNILNKVTTFLFGTVAILAVTL